MTTTPSLNLNYGEYTITTEDLIVKNGLSLASYNIVTDGFTTTEKIILSGDNFVTGTDATITTPSFLVEKSMTLPLCPNPSLSGSILSSLMSSVAIPLITYVQFLTGVFVGCKEFTTSNDLKWYFTTDETNNTFNYPISTPLPNQLTYLLIRTLVNFTPGPIHHDITIAKGTIAPPDNVILDSNDQYISFSTNPALTEYDGTNYILNVDFSLKCKTIASQFSTYNVTFPKNQHIPDGTFLSLEIVNPTVSAGLPFLFNVDGGENNLILSIPFPKGVYFSQSTTFGLGSFISGGNELEKGTIFSPATINTLQMHRIVFESNSLIPSGSEIISANPSACPIKVGKEMVSNQTQLTSFGIYACEGLELSHGTTFPHGYILESDLLINDCFNINSDINVKTGSIITKGSIIKSGTTTMEGMSFTSPVSISSGSVLDSELVYPIDSSVLQNTTQTSQTDIVQGFKFTELSLGPGTLLPDDLVLFGKLRLDTTSNAYLSSGSIFPQNTTLSQGFTIPGNTSFRPEFVFNQFTIFSSGTVFPSGTVFDKDNVLPVQFPIPGNQCFKQGTVLPVGFTFKAGTIIPNSVDFVSNDFTNSSSVNNFNVITIGGVSYYVIPSSSMLLKGKILPSGTFLSQQINGTTTSSNFGTGTSAPSLVFPEGTWQAVNGDIGGIDLTLNPQITVSVSTLPGYIINPSISILEDIQFQSDMLFPVSTTENPLSYITLSSDLVTQIATQLTRRYDVPNPGMVEWPANIALPMCWALHEPLTISTQFTSIRSIKLGENPIPWLTNIIPSNGFITFPTTPTKLYKDIMINTPIKIGVNGSFIGSSTIPAYTGTGSNTYIVLAKGATLSLSTTTTSVATFVSITSSTGNLTSTCPFTLNQTISIYSAFTIKNGSIAPSGSYLLSSIIFPSSTYLPSGITLSSNSVIAHDFKVNYEDDLSILQQGTILNKCSILETGTIFPNGLILLVCAYMYPIKALSQRFTIPVSSNLVNSFYYYQFVDDTLMNFTYDEVIKIILDHLKCNNKC